ncbi:MAG: CopD family protein, partial [Pseudomonadales bacterium]|nr:CopD family protein [Pseudomonadales bacterium]
ILFVMAWMAGLFYLPRILVHYTEGLAAGEDVRRLITMGNKLFRFSGIMAVIALSFGLWLWLGYGIGGMWLMAKLCFVLLLLAYHGQSWAYVRKMSAMEPIHSSLYFRIYNEAALLIVIPILIFVTVKPF